MPEENSTTEVSIEERISEMEETSLLIQAQLNNWFGADPDETRQHESRLRYLLTRIQDRHNARIAARLKAEAEKPKLVIVKEDAEL